MEISILFHDEELFTCLSLMECADVVIKDGAFLKNRYTLEQILDNLDMEKDNTIAELKLSNVKLKALLVTANESLTGGLDCAQGMLNVIIDHVIPPQTELTRDYIRKIPDFVKAQQQNDTIKEDSIIDELDIIWDKMSFPEKEYCEIISAKYFIELKHPEFKPPTNK